MKGVAGGQDPQGIRGGGGGAASEVEGVEAGEEGEGRVAVDLGALYVQTLKQGSSCRVNQSHYS